MGMIKIEYNDEKKKIEKEEIDRFIGKNEIFIKSKICVYCENYVGEEYFIKKSVLNKFETIDYCLHCWSWLNCNDVKLTEGIYLGNLNQNIVFDTIKNTVELHKKIILLNDNCLFNIYESLEKSNKLDVIFCKEIKSNKTDIAIKNKEYKITSRDIKINWEKSEISI